MTRIGVIQGRLVPPVGDRIQAFPRDDWQEEFALAADAGLECIEWIYDGYGEDVNPLATAAGVRRIGELSQRHGVAVRSVCADYFMEEPLVRVTEGERRAGLGKLRWLLGQCSQLGMRRVVLPFVDNSAIETASERESVVDSLETILPTAEGVGIELHLETSLGPEAFRELLSRVPHPLVKVNYDIGNSASLGYDPRDEFAAYGERIGSVHVKDRVLGGGTVPLGTGDADFSVVFMGLRKLGYAGDIILQVARGDPGDEVAWAKRNLAFLETDLPQR